MSSSLIYSVIKIQNNNKKKPFLRTYSNFRAYELLSHMKIFNNISLNFTLHLSFYNIDAHI